MDGDPSAFDLDEAAARFRSLRERLERAVLPLATSLDGRRFTFQAPLHGLDVRVGGYVRLSGDGSDRLGQVLTLGLEVADGFELGGDEGQLGARTRVPVRRAVGEGVVLQGDGRPFHDAAHCRAAPADVAAWLEEIRPRRATLPIGELALEADVPFALDAGGFDRHTFLCGQSGSGKTYALGVVLEQLLLHTDLRILVLDPNSDFTRLAQARDGASPEWASVAPGIVVRSVGAEGTDRLRVRLARLDPATQAAVLGLDPIADREEYGVLVEVLERAGPDNSLADSIHGLLAQGRQDMLALEMRVRNLGVGSWRIWAGDDPGSIDEEVLDGDWRCLVVDLGSVGSRAEQAVVAECVLATLWRERGRRRPLLVVVDEAHNVLPGEPGDPVTARAAEAAVAIAAEGRKFGLYLLVSTQRPQKVSENVLTQCDNVLLMRMNSAADLAFVADAFSFVPASLVAQATGFRQGECLVAGKIASHPAFARVGARLTAEGGADVPADWARPG